MLKKPLVSVESVEESVESGQTPLSLQMKMIEVQEVEEQILFFPAVFSLHSMLSSACRALRSLPHAPHLAFEIQSRFHGL